MSSQNDNTAKKCRPIISSLAFSNQNIGYLPFGYDFTIQQVQQIKKYLPKHLLKLHGIDVQGQQGVSKQESQQLAKSKIKIKGANGKWTEQHHKKQINYLPKGSCRLIQWYNKSINLRIPYSSKSTQQQIQQLVQSYLQYYVDNFVVFKNTLSDELWTGDKMKDKNKLSVEEISTEWDVVFLEWAVESGCNDDQQQIVRVNVPIVLCLNNNQTYSLQTIKSLLKTDILSSLAIQLKHQFNTRILLSAKSPKQLLCLNSYCNQQNALHQQDKLKSIIGQQQKSLTQQQVQSIKVTANKDHKLLILVLAFLVMIYVYLKIFPINGRDGNQYMRQPQEGQVFNNDTLINSSSDEQIF